MSQVTQAGKKRRWAVMERFDIMYRADSTKRLLGRLRVVQTPLFGIYLHELDGPDVGSPHDHPWWFGSLVLRGGYTEEWYAEPWQDEVANYRMRHRRWSRFSWHAITTTEAHKIVTVDPRSLTLVFVGRKRRNWGFFTEVGWVPWQEYVRPSDLEARP